jgi:hypothetical protein
VDFFQRFLRIFVNRMTLGGRKSRLFDALDKSRYHARRVKLGIPGDEFLNRTERFSSFRRPDNVHASPNSFLIAE